MDNAVAVGCERFVVGDDDECLPHVAPQVEKQAVELGAVVAVETARGFVGKHHGRTVDECAGHCRTLLFAARKLCGAVRGAVGKSEIVNEFLRPRQMPRNGVGPPIRAGMATFSSSVNSGSS